MNDLDHVRASMRHAYLQQAGQSDAYHEIPVRRTSGMDICPIDPPPPFGSPPWRKALEDVAFQAARRRQPGRPEIDHCPVDAASIIQRIDRLASSGDAQGALLCIGDNDHIAPVAALMCQFYKIVVLDVEPSVLEDVSELNERLGGASIECVQLDIRKSSEVENFISTHDRLFTTATTDPPYTSTGFASYLHLAVRCLRLGGALHLVAPYMLFEDWTVLLLHDIHRFSTAHGLVMTDMWRCAQTFQIGAGVVSSIIRSERRLLQSELINLDRSAGAFYTLAHQ